MLFYMSTKMLVLTGIPEHACESYPPGFTFMASDTCSWNFEGKFPGTTEIDACGWPILTCVHPLIHQGFCVEARTLRSLFQTFDMYVLYPHNTIISMPLSLLVVGGLIFDLSRSFHIMLVLQDRKLVSACLSQKQCWHYCIYWLIVHILLLVVDFQENWSLNLTSVGM
jgi:hypothetical protein